MLILYVASKHDYGDPANGFSYEHWNFLDSLVGLGHDLLYFDFPGLLAKHGRAAMNRRLVEVARERQPELMFTVLVGEELDRKAVRAITATTDTTTVNWFCDDHWRFENFTRAWAPCFDWSITTSTAALAKYRACGLEQVLKSQWACNPRRYRPLALPPAHDVSFVGLPHGERPALVAGLRAAGIDVRAWGRGWDAGRLDQQGLVEVFNRSRINLNFAAAAAPAAAPSPPSALRLAVGRAARRVPGASALARALRRLRGEPPPVPASSLPAQIKGRIFEVTACGGFLLTQPAEDLDACFTPGKEIACFDDGETLLAAVRHYLAHEDERLAIAAAGRDRVLRDHTWALRFAGIFPRMGLPAAADAGTTGTVEEIA